MGKKGPESLPTLEQLNGQLHDEPLPTLEELNGSLKKNDNINTAPGSTSSTTLPASSAPAKQGGEPSGGATEGSWVQDNFDTWSKKRQAIIENDYKSQFHKETSDYSKKLGLDVQPDLTNKEQVESYNKKVNEFNQFQNKRSKELSDQYDKKFKDESTQQLEKINSTLKKFIGFESKETAKSVVPPEPSAPIVANPNDPFGIGQTVLKQLYQGFGDQIPKTTVQAKEVLTSALQDANIEEYIKRRKNVDFQKYVREKEDIPFYKPFEWDKSVDEWLTKYKDQYVKDRGLEQTQKNIEARQPEITQRRLETEQYVQEQNKEAAGTLQGIPQSYKQVKGPEDFIRYGTNLATQGLWQIPLTIVTKGLSGEIMEAAQVYDEQLDQLADKHKISREDVIKQRLDKPAEGQLYAITAAALDRASAGGVLDIVKKGGSSLLKKALTVTTETLTEPTQGVLEEMGGAKGAGLGQVEAFKKALTTNISKRIDEAAGGFFGSGVATALSPSEVVSEQHVQVKDSGDQDKLKRIEELQTEIGIAESKQKRGEANPVSIKALKDELITLQDYFDQKEEIIKKTSDGTNVPGGNELDKGTGQPATPGVPVATNVTTIQEGVGQVDKGNVGGETVTQPQDQSDADIEKRMSEIQDDLSQHKEFSRLEKIMEARERASVFNVPLEDASKAIDALMVKEKTQPNGWGSFIEKRDASESKNVIERYSNPKEISDNEIKKDFKEALMGNPSTWYADGLKLRESANLAASRGIEMKSLLSEVEKEFLKDGYDAKTAKEVIAGYLKPILQTNQPHDDSLNKPRVQGDLGEGQEPVQGQPEQGAGGEKISPNRIFSGQGQEEKVATQKLFVYGTLKNEKNVKKAVGENIPQEEHTIPGLVREGTDKDYSTVRKGEGEVRGKMMEVTPEQLEKLKKSESNYDLQEVQPGVMAFVRKADINPKGEQVIAKPESITAEKKRLLTKEPTSTREAVLQYFANGGKINTQSLKEETGFGTKRGINQTVVGKGELNARKTLKADDGPTVGGEPQTPQSGEVVPPAEPPKAEDKGEGPTRQYAILKRIEDGNANEAIKRGVKEKGDTYIPKGLDITSKEADDLIALYGDKAEGVVRDITNGLTPDTRTAITAKLYKQYAEAGQNDKAIDIAMWQAEQSMQAGRAGNAAKIWKMITQSGEDHIVLAIEKEQGRQVERVVEPVRAELNQSREQIDAEVRRLIEQKVQEGIKDRLGRAKLITQEKKQQISDFFDSLKVETPKGGMLLASPIPGLTLLPHIWNGSVEVIKQAVLTGASVANAVQAGIDYIRANQKEPFDEKVYRDTLTPQVEKLVPVDATKVDATKIDVPKLTGRKKKEFIDEVVKAHNEGKLTDKKFDELYAKKLGVKELSTKDRDKIRALARTISEAEKFEEELKKGFTPENIKKNKAFLKLAQKANQQLQEFATDRGTIPETLIAIMQANVMATLSLVSNPYYNLALQPIRFSSSGVASMLDFSISGLAKLGLLAKLFKPGSKGEAFLMRTVPRTMDMVALQKGYFKPGWNGFVEGAIQIKTGAMADERNLREISSKFNPRLAIGRWGNKDRTTKQKINDAIEGTIGWESEAVFRVLNFGDKPWKRAAEGARARELGVLKGLKGKELEKFIMLPDEESKVEIIKAGQEATFQQSSKGGKWLQNVISSGLNLVEETAEERLGPTFGPFVGGAAKIIGKSQVLFIKTPYNMIGLSLDLATSPVTLVRGIAQMSKGNRREGLQLIGRAAVGAALTAAITKLFVQGIMTGDDDKEDKKRRAQKDSPVPPANSINVSALLRMRIGEEPSIQDNDRWVEYKRMGVFGVLSDVYTNLYKGRIANGQPPVGADNPFIVDLLEAFPRVASSTLDQTFLQGTSSALDALMSGDERKQNKWLIQSLETVGTIIYPNTIATIAKASDEYTRDLEDPVLWEKLKNTFKAKMWAGGDLPAKVSIWGDKITGVPEGRNKYFSYLVDPTKFKDVDTDDYRYRLYELFKKDYDAAWWPSIPDRKITYKGEPMALTPKEYEQMCIYVGEQRAALTSAYMNSDEGKGKSMKEVKDDLTSIYKEGREFGEKQFLMNNGLNVTFKYSPPRSIKKLEKIGNKPRKSLMK